MKTILWSILFVIVNGAVAIADDYIGIRASRYQQGEENGAALYATAEDKSWVGTIDCAILTPEGKRVESRTFAVPNPPHGGPIAFRFKSQSNCESALTAAEKLSSGQANRLIVHTTANFVSSWELK